MTRIRPEDVSLYIPARNSARTLRAAIESVQTQTLPPAEFFLLLDTRSTDATVEIARNSGLRIVVQTEGRLGHGRNLAIQACRTPWLASCDADVVLEPTWLAALLHAADDDVAAVGGGTNEAPLTDADRWRAVNMPHNWGPLPFDNPFMLVSEMMARVAALRSVGGYRADLQAWEDSDLCQRLRHAGYTLRYEPAAAAWHTRGDSIAGVLDLRWKYSFARQRFRLQNLPGLIDKLSINRVYALQSLSQTLHSEHADCCAISVLLWFHHARKDLQAALAHWPLLDEAARGECVAMLDETTTSCLSGVWRRILEPMQTWLGPPPVPPTPDRRSALSATEGFSSYLAAAREATVAFLAAVPDELVPALVQSAQRLAAVDPSWPFQLPPLRVQPTDEEQLAARPLQPAWTWTELQGTLAAAIDRDLAEARLSGYGPHLLSECPPQEKRGQEPLPTPRLALLPHLEASVSPREALRDVLSAADVAVIGYQPPQVFLPAVPILSARDLASECAAAGFAIRNFHTEAGLTRLIVQRESAALEEQPREPIAVAAT